LKDKKIVYVLTDVVDSNIEFWRRHRYINDLAEEGLIDYAKYNPACDTTIDLILSREQIAPGKVKSPIVFIANYLFDVLPQDLFSLEDNTVFANLIKLVTDNREIDTESEDFLSHLWMTIEKEDIDPSHHYDDPFISKVFNNVISHYREYLSESKISHRFLFPFAALGAIRNLSALSGTRGMLLMGERPGSVRQDYDIDSSDIEEEVSKGLKSAVENIATKAVEAGRLGLGEAVKPAYLLAMGLHGTTFSLPVDTEILSIGAKDLSARLLKSESLPVGLEMGVFLFTSDKETPGLEEDFFLSLEEQTPEEIFLILRNLRQNKANLSLADLVIAVRASGYDSHFLFQIYDVLQDVLQNTKPDDMSELARVLLEVDRRHFPMDIFVDNTKDTKEAIADNMGRDIGTSGHFPGGLPDIENQEVDNKKDDTEDRNQDLSSILASILAPIGQLDAALELLRRYRARRGVHPSETFNMALCLALQGKREEAIERAEEVLRMDPNHSKAQQLLKEIRHFA
jgi:hypothetical protein